MLSIHKIGNTVNERRLKIVGLSTDEKPLKKIDGVEITNGSILLEMDTSNIFIYDKENHRWLETDKESTKDSESDDGFIEL